MPELPEVQTIVDDLKALGVIGSTITRVRILWPRSVARLTPGDFKKKVIGRTIRRIDRRGKFIRFYLDQGLCMAVHLRMTGKFSLVSPQKRHGKHEHILIGLGSLGQLRFHDTRKFGRFYLLEPDDPFFQRLGPEPLDDELTVDRFHTMLERRSRHLKPLLLDQTFIAGLGNIYVDEALWYARIHPLAKADTLDSKQAQMLLKSIRKVLRIGLENAGTTLGLGEGNYASMRGGRGKNEGNLKVFRRTEQPCRRCGQPIKRIIVGQRSTHLCLRCQSMD